MTAAISTVLTGNTGYEDTPRWFTASRSHFDRRGPPARFVAAASIPSV
jgi:hypothetical protein